MVAHESLTLLSPVLLALAILLVLCAEAGAAIALVPVHLLATDENLPPR